MAARDDHIRKLTEAMEGSRPLLEKLDRYYSGTQPLAFLAPEVATAVGTRLKSLVVNWPRLVVGAVEERLDVDGFRLAPDAEPDSDLWRVWQANNLDEGSQQAHAEALIHGRSFAIVWTDAAGDPLITIESARQVLVEHRPGTRTRLRAIKKYIEDGYAHVTLYEPQEITRWRSRGKAVEGVGMDYVPAGGWMLQETISNPLGVVPVVPLLNRPRLMSPDGESELSDVLPLADAINKLATDLLVTSEFHAMPRRYATGIEISEEPQLDPETGEPVTDEFGNTVMVPSQQFASAAGRVWVAEDPESKFGQFPEAQLDGFVNAIAMLTQQLGALSGLPPHYLALHGDQPASADAIRSSEASLVAKARRKQRSFGGSWEEVMRLALQVRDGSVPREADRLETIWRDPETRTVAQAADAAVKLVAAGIVPAQQALEDLGYSPVQIERMRTMRRQDALDRVVVDLDRLTP